MSNKKKLPELAENIKAFRLQAGLSQAALGKKVHYSQQIINAYENGERVPPPATLELLAGIFETTVDALLGYKPSKPKPQPATKIIKQLRIVESLPPKDQKKVLEYVKLLTKANG